MRCLFIVLLSVVTLTPSQAQGVTVGSNVGINTLADAQAQGLALAVDIAYTENSTCTVMSRSSGAAKYDPFQEIDVTPNPALNEIFSEEISDGEHLLFGADGRKMTLRFDNGRSFVGDLVPGVYTIVIADTGNLARFIKIQ